MQYISNISKKRNRTFFWLRNAFPWASQNFSSKKEKNPFFISVIAHYARDPHWPVCLYTAQALIVLLPACHQVQHKPIMAKTSRPSVTLHFLALLVCNGQWAQRSTSKAKTKKTKMINWASPKSKATDAGALWRRPCAERKLLWHRSETSAKTWRRGVRVAALSPDSNTMSKNSSLLWLWRGGTSGYVTTGGKKPPLASDVVQRWRNEREETSKGCEGEEGNLNIDSRKQPHVWRERGERGGKVITHTGRNRARRRRGRRRRRGNGVSSDNSNLSRLDGAAAKHQTKPIVADLL